MLVWQGKRVQAPRFGPLIRVSEVDVKTRIISQDEVRRLLPMDACIEVMQEAFLLLSKGGVTMPLRTVMPLPVGNLFGLMPSMIADKGVFGAKVISVFPGNHGSPNDSHQGVVLLYETEHGCLQAIVDATAITGIRTAAVSAVATRALANPGARTLALIGAGTQARAHLDAMSLLYDLRDIRVWSIVAKESEGFARSESERTGLDISSSLTAEKAVEGADLICTVTAAREPVLRGRWIKAGAHINAIGACTASSRELDTEAVLMSRLFVDRIEAAQNEAGDFIIPRNEGAIGDSHIRGELGDIVSGKVRGRGNPDEITLFKAVGLSMQDMAAAQYVCMRAKEEGLGVDVELGGKVF